MNPNTFYYHLGQENNGTHFECGGVFDLNAIPLLLEIYETHLLDFVVNSENLGALYNSVSMGIFEEKERLEILLDKINTTLTADPSDIEKKELKIDNYYTYFSVLRPAGAGQVFWATGLVPSSTPSQLSEKVKSFSEKLVQDMKNLGQQGGVGYNPTKVEKSVLEL